MSSANTPSKEQTPQWEILVQYILTYQHHCDKYLSPIADPKGKSVLIIGCGAGTEILWCIRNQAKSITAIDTRPHDPTVVEEAMKRISVKCRTSVDVHKMSLYEAYSLKGQYDLVLSNNVFEHLEDVNKAFSICRQLVLPGEGRIAIFTNPLYYSSMGAHLSGIEPWEHLWTSPEKIKGKTKEWEYKNYLKLNKMRLRDFVQAITDNQIVAIQLNTVPDRNISRFRYYHHLIDPTLSRTDLLIEGISMEGMVLG